MVKKNQMGLCSKCRRPLAAGSKTMCAKHLKIHRNRVREKTDTFHNPRAWMENKDRFWKEVAGLDWNSLGFEGVAKIYRVTPNTARTWAKALGIRRVFVTRDGRIAGTMKVGPGYF